LSDLVGVLVNSLLPVLLAAGAGYPLGKWLHVNPRPFSQVIFYVFSPCLIFILLTDNKLNGGDVARVIILAVSVSIVVGTATWCAGRVMKMDRRLLAAVLLTSILMNAGNIGLPLTQFAFGDTALAFATLFFVINIVISYTFGVVIASMGTTTLWTSIFRLFKLPTFYTLILAILFNIYGWKLPLPLDRTVRLLSSASIPCMLILLGLQIQRASLNDNRRGLLLAGSMRLLVAPLLALGLGLLLGLKGPAYQATVLESGMPTAVVSTVLSTEFDTLPTFVTSAVFLSTLLSPLTISPLIVLLGG
jgi:predicted permease